MSGKSTLKAAPEQLAELKKLAKSHVRDEADRARGVLRTLDGWSGPEIAEAFGVTEDSVRHWRLWFSEGGVDALRAVLAPGPSAERGEKATEIAAELLAVPVEGRTNWTLPRLADEIGRRGVKISPSRLSVVLKKRLRLAASPSHADRATGCRGRQPDRPAAHAAQAAGARR